MSTEIPSHKPVSAKEAAEILGVNERTVRRAIARGELPATKRGSAFLITREAIESYASAPTRRPQPPPTPQSIPATPTTLPATGGQHRPQPPGELLGRDEEFTGLIAALQNDDPSARLFTITGPGGIGKTRLALEVASSLERSGYGQVVVVPLASVRDPDLVAPTIVQAFGILPGTGLEGLRLILDAIAGTRAVLVLDCMEHLLAAIAIIPVLLSRSSSLRVIVTSRIVLNLTGEHVLRLQPLSVQDSLRPDDVERAPAVALFLERASATGTDIDHSEQSLAIVQSICDRLDGLPLAIELAAASVKILPPRAILTHLERRLPLLGRGNRDAPARQQTMSATIAWSYDLLAEPERVLFRRLAALPGGGTVAAVGAVTRWLDSGFTDRRRVDWDDRISTLPLLDSLGRLVNQSLVTWRESSDDEARFTMLETVREYGLERLQESGELPDVNRAIALMVLDLAEHRSLANQRGRDEIGHILDDLDAEHDNIRSGLTWAATFEPPVASRITAGIWRFWSTRGYLIEGRRWLETVLASVQAGSAGEIAPETLAELHYGLGSLDWSLLDSTAAIDHFQTALKLRRQLYDLPGMAHALRRLGGIYVRLDDPTPAEPYLREALLIFRSLRDPVGEGICLVNLGLLAQARGNPAAALPLLAEAVDLLRGGDDPEHTAYALTTLGSIQYDLGDNQTAAAAYGESLALFRFIGDRQGSLDALDGIAQVARHVGRFEDFQHLTADATIVRRQLGIPVDLPPFQTQLTPVGGRPPPESDPVERVTPTLRKVVSRAIALADELSGPSAAPAYPPTPLDALSPRELEILAMVAEGQADRDIASQLSISPRTVMHHVASIRSKLGVSSRTAAAGIALRQIRR